MIDNFLYIIKMMFHSFNFLIFFVPLSCNKNNIAVVCHFTSCSNCLPTVFNSQVLIRILWLYTLFHFAKDFIRIFLTWIVGCKNNCVAHLSCYVCHLWTFFFITIASATYNRNQLFVSGSYFRNGFQYIFQSVGRVCIINNSCNICFGNNKLETPRNTFQTAYMQQNLIRS